MGSLASEQMKHPEKRKEYLNATEMVMDDILPKLKLI
jgi:hypothetical protein